MNDKTRRTATQVGPAMALLLPALLGGCSLRFDTTAHVTAQLGGPVRAGLEHPCLLRDGDGQAVLGVVIDPPLSPAAGASQPARAAVALALVIDTSGSMEGEKIEHARAAARSFIDSLSDGDELAVVAFEDEPRVLVPRVRVAVSERAQLVAAVSALQAGGGTGIAAGLRAGLNALDGAAAPTRRLLLISDGHASSGPLTAGDIVAALPPRTSPPVTLSTLGVGTDYDEEVMAAIARVGTGGFHHLTDPVQLASILDDELRHARQVVAEGALVELWPERGVAILDAPGLELVRDPSGAVRVSVGSLYSGERRTVAIPVRLPVDGQAVGVAARVRVSYRAGGPSGGPVARELSVNYHVTSDAAEAQVVAAPELESAADRLRVAHVLSDAAALLREGDLLEAQAILRDERGRIDKRRDRLTGRERADADLLSAMLHDPFVDANLAPPPAVAAPASGSAPAPSLPALIERARKGEAISDGELGGLDREALRLLRNVPYARHGYRFQSAELSAAFGKLGWWHADPAFDERRLTATDVDTIARVRAFENRAALVASVRAPVAKVPAARRPAFEALLARASGGGRLAAGDVDGLDLAQLRVLRNAAYARHGYIFRTADLGATFGRFAWYHADPTFNESRLAPLDRANIDLCRSRERQLVAGADGEALRDVELRSRAGAFQAMH